MEIRTASGAAGNICLIFLSRGPKLDTEQGGKPPKRASKADMGPSLFNQTEKIFFKVYVPIDDSVSVLLNRGSKRGFTKKVRGSRGLHEYSILRPMDGTEHEGKPLKLRKTGNM